jgi:hypothetical protein
MLKTTKILLESSVLLKQLSREIFESFHADVRINLMLNLEKSSIPHSRYAQQLGSHAVAKLRSLSKISKQLPSC